MNQPSHPVQQQQQQQQQQRRELLPQTRAVRQPRLQKKKEDGRFIPKRQPPPPLPLKKSFQTFSSTGSSSRAAVGSDISTLSGGTPYIQSRRLRRTRRGFVVRFQTNWVNRPLDAQESSSSRRRRRERKRKKKRSSSKLNTLLSPLSPLVPSVLLTAHLRLHCHVQTTTIPISPRKPSPHRHKTNTTPKWKSFNHENSNHSEFSFPPKVTAVQVASTGPQTQKSVAALKRSASSMIMMMMMGLESP